MTRQRIDLVKHILPAVVLATALAAPAALITTQAMAEDAVCYNCPPQWADWASMLEAIDKNIDVQMPHDNKNSGQTLSQLLAERKSPVADVAYYGVTTGIKAGSEGVAEPYKPAGFDDIPEGLKDPEGKWFAIHYGTLGFFVNVDALGGAPVPQCFADLKKPEYRGMVGYLDPSSAFVGYAGAVAANLAFGGDLGNFNPAIDYFKDLAKNDPIVPKQTSYARVVSGEIPILFDYDFNAYRGKYEEDGNFEFVLPCEGSVRVPYVMSLVKDAPHPELGKRVLDFILSDAGQAIWTNAYLQPSRPVKLPAEVAAKFLPASDYARAVAVDYAEMEKAQAGFGERYLSEVK
jgi:putative spermidine/putrescine transport system substrate-binding protein